MIMFNMKVSSLNVSDCHYLKITLSTFMLLRVIGQGARTRGMNEWTFQTIQITGAT